MSQFNIRTATLDDASAIAEVHVATWQSAYKGLMPDELLQNLNIERRKQGWQTIISEDATAIIVAEVAGQVVGFSNFGASRDPGAAPTTGEIYAIYLLAAHWGEGIGKAMMETSLHRLEKRDYDSTMLWVLKTNQRTIDFYTGMGFSLDGEAKVEQWGDFQLHEVRMVRPIQHKSI